MADEYQIIDPKKSSVKIIMLVFGLLLLTTFTFAVYFVTKVNKAASTDNVPVNFHVAKGSSTRTIAYALDEQRVINNPTVFLLYTKIYGASGKIQAGDYALNRNMSIAEVVDVLTLGKVVRDERNITIVEGQSNRELAAYLESRNIYTAADFNAALEKDYEFKFLEQGKKVHYEGFLFPDTYTISKNETSEELIQKMLSNFEKKTESLFVEPSADNMNVMDVMILASIVEKEVGRNKEVITSGDRAKMQEERTLVSSVFVNRLKIGMPLESDATVNYITGKSDRRALFTDTKVQSPYNTYQVKGLPPGPISNPGLGAIEAAIHPAVSDYYFFLNNKEGLAYFGRTLSEHNQNRSRYLD